MTKWIIGELFLILLSFFFVSNGNSFPVRNQSIEVRVTFLSRTLHHLYFSFEGVNSISSGDEVSIAYSESITLRGIIDAASSRYLTVHFTDTVTVSFRENQIFKVQILPNSDRADKLNSLSLKDSSRQIEVVQKSKMLHDKNLSSGTVSLLSKKQEKDLTGQSPSLRRQNIRGLFSMEYYQSDALERGRYNIQQPSARFKFYGRNLGGTNWEMRMHVRSREDRRKRLGKTQYKSEYLHRIYEASFQYDNPDSKFNLSIGRLFSSQLISVGYLDGTIASIRALPWFSVGGFIGIQPDIDRGDLKNDVVKSGGFAEFSVQRKKIPFYSSAIAFTRQLRKNKLDREFIYLQNRLNLPRRIFFYQSGELNIQKGSGSMPSDKVELVNLYGSLQYYIGEKYQMGLSHDARKNYRTLLNLSIPDSLFDNHMRQGIRLNVSGNVLSHSRITFSFGARGNPTGSTTSSYSMCFYSHNILGTQFTGIIQVSAFKSVQSAGINPSMGIAKTFFSRWYADLTIGEYRYHILGFSPRNTHWIRLNQSVDIFSRWFIATELEYNQGDDVKSFQTFFHGGFHF